MKQLVDPVDLVGAALEQLPDDPHDARPEHLPALAAVAEGLGGHALSVRVAQLRLAGLVERGAVEPADAIADLDWLGALSRRIQAAGRLLDDYSSAACAALNLDIGQLVEVADPKTKE